MSLLELPRKHGGPRTFVEAEAGFRKRLGRACDSLLDLREHLDWSELDDMVDALIAVADEIDGDPDLEDDELGDDEALPLFAHAGVSP